MPVVGNTVVADDVESVVDAGTLQVAEVDVIVVEDLLGTPDVISMDVGAWCRRHGAM